ncbi:hypothetical protein OMP38_29435 [Cohnella ginsengisoli]|uniref:Uncharacterized protein n=1 Tax=Cohnella ginsengisoli TaxID=425004 RepID=A0A9X4KMB8_9BACL|nr:hypothetical protein [Cohnella ginsengisoli]MDG0794500.1 hypothetical protein [Cohnella ginsengisoli]
MIAAAAMYMAGNTHRLAKNLFVAEGLDDALTTLLVLLGSILPFGLFESLIFYHLSNRVLPGDSFLNLPFCKIKGFIA